MRDAIERAALSAQRRQNRLNEYKQTTQGLSAPARFVGSVIGGFQQAGIDRDVEALRPQMQQLAAQEEQVAKKRKSELANAIAQATGIKINPDNFDTETLQALRQKQVAGGIVSPLEKQEMELKRRKIDVEERDIIRKEGNAQLRQDLLKSWQGNPAQQNQIKEATKPIKGDISNLENIIDSVAKKVNKAAQFAAATGDDTLLKAAEAEYDVALDSYNRKSGKDINDSEFQAAGFFERMKSAENGARAIGEGGFPTLNVELVSGAAGKMAANFARNPEQQVFARAADDWIRAKLRKESGAVIADEEMKDEFRTYFPVVGDSPEVIVAKRKAREIAMRSMGRAGSRALNIDSPELGLEEAAPKPEQADLSQVSTDELLRMLNE